MAFTVQLVACKGVAFYGLLAAEVNFRSMKLTEIYIFLILCTNFPYFLLF